ncbi:hypothetical protein ACCO45_003164 [Purpureocillium lilacinum]|uniref:Uncharacterized protein n=1 Tax=Purpureocillium lilacinum TaxID=33203 RepID=A0ACC4DZF6_PURLI
MGGQGGRGAPLKAFGSGFSARGRPGTRWAKPLFSGHLPDSGGVVGPGYLAPRALAPRPRRYRVPPRVGPVGRWVLQTLPRLPLATQRAAQGASRPEIVTVRAVGPHCCHAPTPKDWARPHLRNLPKQTSAIRLSCASSFVAAVLQPATAWPHPHLTGRGALPDPDRPGPTLCRPGHPDSQSSRRPHDALTTHTAFPGLEPTPDEGASPGPSLLPRSISIVDAPGGEPTQWAARTVGPPQPPHDARSPAWPEHGC